MRRNAPSRCRDSSSTAQEGAVFNVARPAIVASAFGPSQTNEPTSLMSGIEGRCSPHELWTLTLEEVRRRNMEEMAAGKPSKRDIFTHGPYEGVHR